MESKKLKVSRMHLLSIGKPKKNIKFSKISFRNFKFIYVLFTRMLIYINNVMCKEKLHT
jgi:hypothetical protein